MQAQQQAQPACRSAVAAALLITGLAQAQTLPPPPVSPAPVVNYEYDAQGNPTRTVQAPNTSGFNFATTNTYDKLNRQKDSTDAKAGVTRFGYDGLDRTVQVTDPRNLVTQSPRNGLGDATSLVSPDTGTATHTYDAAGNLKTRTDSRGVLATYSYDALNRLTSIVYGQSGQTSLSYSWNYDETGTGFANGIGRLTSTSHPAGSTQYAYDPQGRLTTETQMIHAAIGANSVKIIKTIGYTYDAAGHIAGITYPSGHKVGITHTNGLPSAITFAKDASTTPQTLLSQIGFDPFGGAKSWQWQMAAGTQAYDRVRDTYGRLVRYRLGNTMRDITYDAGDRITAYTHYDAATAAATPALDQGFGYDELGRLTSITTSTASWSVGYDANGNRTGVTLNGTASTYTTSATSNRLTSITNPARGFGYDNAGNTTSDTGSGGGGYASVYDAAGRLATLTKAGLTSSFSYDGMGKRVRKFISAGPGAGAYTTVLFAYDQNNQLLGEYDSTGATLREYIWLGSTPVAMVTPSPVETDPPDSMRTQSSTSFFKSDIVAGATSQQIFYIHTDHLDTPRVVVDRSNNLRWRWVAEPFGTTAPETNPQSFGDVTQNLRFPGQVFDQETGLFYNWNRYLDSSLGRYTSFDPTGLAGGINGFIYVDGNPLSYVDLDGLQPAIPAPLIGPGIGAIARPGVGTLVDPIATPGTPDPNDPLNNQKCQNLQKRIKNLRDEIYNKRYPDLQANPGRLPQRIGPGEALRDTVRGHEKLLNRQLRRLRELEDQFDKECLC